jgi:hypothetical protein
MTVEVAKRRTRPRKAKVVTDSITIGEIGQTVFTCPTCDRPLPLRSRRCSACGTRFILGIEAKRASTFIGVGLFVGLLASIALVAVVMTADRLLREANAAAVTAAAEAAATVQAALPSPIPSAAPVATAGSGSTAAGSTSTVPGLSRSALTHAASVDARLLESSTALAAALAASDFDTFTVAQTLRSMSGDAVFGLQLTPHIGAWSAGEDLAADLAAFYGAVKETAGEGLEASIRNERAYRAAAAAMLRLLARLPEIDAEIGGLASDAGVVLPSQSSASSPTP